MGRLKNMTTLKELVANQNLTGDNDIQIIKAFFTLNDMEEEGMEWYLNLRKYGGCIHSGFGMGFERLIIYLTGVDNIRDVIPYPRTPGNCDY